MTVIARGTSRGNITDMGNNKKEDQISADTLTDKHHRQKDKPVTSRIRKMKAGS